MTRQHVLVVLTLTFTSGCYESHRAPTPSPCDDPEFVGPSNLTFDATGHLLGEPFEDDRFQSVAGWSGSLSDDGRWLVTSSWQPPTDRLVAHITDLTTGDQREHVLGSPGTSVASISGDGSTLVFVRGGVDVTDGRLVVLDRVSLEERVVAYGRIGAGFGSRIPTISDDARRALMWVFDGGDATGIMGILLDLETRAANPLPHPGDEYIHGGTLSGDGDSTSYWSLGHPDDPEPAEPVLMITGPGGRVQPITGVTGYDGISDDGCEVVAVTHAGEYLGGAPILGMALFVGGRRVAMGPEGAANVLVSHLVISGDGGTAAMAVANAEDTWTLARMRLADGRVETQDLLGCSVGDLALSDDGAVIAVDVFGCLESEPEPNGHTRVFRPGVW